MRRISRVIGVLLACWTTSFAEDVMFQEFEVYEFDENRFAPNDTKPTLYKIKLAGKVDALWIEGDDYNYQWLTIVPYVGIVHVKLDRRRGNPFMQDTGSWIGKQLAKAGDIRGWFTITYKDRKGADREVVLLAPVKGDRELADFLRKRSAAFDSEGDPREPEPLLPQPQSPEPAAPEVAPSRSVSTPPLTVLVLKVVDLMTVSEFRAAGLAKLTDAELEALDAWLNSYVKSSR
ncbi:MAG: hypothetical protein CME19_00935 [Gemmatimonadetes bacterium]|nr:hypothetical protein [Gemmatimonadota bacterium]